MNIKVVVFDFDGTLVDSNRLKDEAWSAVFKDNPEISLSLVADVLTRNVGTRFDILRDIFVRSGAPKQEIDALVSDYAARYELIVHNGIADLGVAPGTKEMLEILSPDRCLYINSATPPEPLHASVKRLGIHKYFKDVFGMPPTKEENLRRIIAREGATGEELAVVGDGESDWQSAQACNCRFIGVANDSNRWKDTPFSLIRDLNELHVLLL